MDEVEAPEGLGDLGDLTALTADVAAAWLGQDFVARGPAGEVPLVLARVTDTSDPEAPAGSHSCSLEFEGPAEPAMGQGIVALCRPGGTPSEVFVVPIAQHGGVRVYEACFAYVPPSG